MADYNSSLPVRTQNNGDVVASIADGTTPTQLLAIDASGAAKVAGEGTAGSPTGGVVSVQGVSGGTVLPENLTQIAGASVSTAASGIQKVGIVGNMGTAVDSAAGTPNGQAVTVQGNAAGVPVPVSGTVTANQGTANTIGNAWPVKPTDGTNSQSFTSAGSAKTDIEQIVGASPSASNSLPVQITNGSAFNGPTSPLFVTLSDTVGSSVDSYQTSAALASGANVNLDYTVTAGKTFYTKQLWASASGKIKVILEYETGVATGIFNTFWAGFNSTAETNVLIPVPTSKTQVAGARIRVNITNEDKASMDVYETLSGTEQ